MKGKKAQNTGLWSYFCSSLRLSWRPVLLCQDPGRRALFQRRAGSQLLPSPAPPPPRGEAGALFTRRFRALLFSCFSASAISCETTLKTNKRSSLIKRRPKGKKNEIGAERLRDERCSHSFSGPVRGGVCLSEQLQSSREPGLWTSAPNFDNFVLSAVVLAFFHIFFPLMLWVKMSQIKTSHSL